MYDVYSRATDVTMNFPKMWRYGLGVSLEQSILDCLSELILAKNAPRSLKAAYLLRANAYLEIIILKLRLALEKKLANETKLFQIQANLSEVGRMLGGWLKATQSPS
jgi:hypothetical protein